ncbi:hypothetical protein OI25_7565 [Paraburkholderia fungorum]|jgi:hypothetical protein|uniref:Uncharacterized protein n=2 Tax=Burkholderiaceae TaxID=119060 RepID=A0AAU8SZV5_9BURK|nr:hypothetical protein [Paraburkholderia fungorum]AJZ56917.1 hypothetical protein OI25_7565 [Paraburkholderia fungorum]USX11037.1 hypothetical protein NHH62_41140 [Paraburkholderia fungorum]
MFFKSFVRCFRGAVHAPRPTSIAARLLSSQVRENWSLRIAACAARAHFLVAPSIDRVTVGSAGWLSNADGTRRSPINQLRRVGRMFTRAALRAAYAGGPLTPTGYAILALTVGAVALVAMLSASSAGDELGSALRLSWWFS